jgi:hypothetical protein
MRTISDIIAAIKLKHGEVTLTPADLLKLVAEIDDLECEIDELHDAANNAAIERELYSE